MRPHGQGAPAQPSVPKRHAYEPPSSLLRRPGFDPHMKRPLSTVAGAMLVLLSALALALFFADVASDWFSDTADEAVWIPVEGLTEEDRRQGLVVFLVFGGVVVLIEVVLAVLVLQGRNWPRVTVMTSSTITISIAFAGWWAGGQEITFDTSLFPVATDILLLLALSSRTSAAYARRFEVVADPDSSDSPGGRSVHPPVPPSSS